MAINCVRHFNLRTGEEQIVSYLPLSHVAAMLADIYLPMACAGTTSFADKNALKVWTGRDRGVAWRGTGYGCSSKGCGRKIANCRCALKPL